MLPRTRASSPNCSSPTTSYAGTNRDLELFAYSASHDLQEPLRTIALFAQLIKSRQPANGDIDPLQQIITAAQRMDTLMHDIRST